ncbi:TonB-dependent receptor plug domain-containing protein [Aliikangiella coralliicola]|uniref:TonB-dependent receptor n=1 Tax=Aliikangiella coralliicola TaxID=2592383 RepID=A0A545UF24_9GAMM|nr:TonB-dependent receptor [Aliikangiella coralliicola]TQV88077.1 TonB-dependent receptor [Aliikangiella coralliicola]
MLAVIKKASLLLMLSGPFFEVVADDLEDQEMANLLALLEEETELATQSKMNADYVPGMVTILHGKRLQSYGVSTVMDALNQVAGFYSSVNNVGDPVAIVRGVGTSLNASNIKILINGVAVNRPVDASADWALRLPINQVDRIEIIRGPGSALYGEYAFSGVVNIITREDNGVGLKLGSYQSKQGDVLYHRTFNTGAQLSVNLSVWDRDNSGLTTNEDSFAARGLGHSPGFIYDHEQGQVLFAAASHHGYEVQLQLADVERGGWYGDTAVLPMDLEPREEKVSMFQVKKEWEINNDLQLAASLSNLQTDFKFATILPIPAGIDPPGPPPPIVIERFRQGGNADTTNRFGLNLHWSASDQHKLFVELNHVRNKVDSAFDLLYALGEPPVINPPDRTNVIAGSTRRITSVTLQDQWQVNEQLELTLGARYDDYNDWGSNTSPRLAAVWRVKDNHIFKAQYAEAFRPPTMEELYPGPRTFPGAENTSLDQESLRSSELAYIYRNAFFSFHATLFDTKVEDLIEFVIQPPGPPVWLNRGEIDTMGLELEWRQKFERHWDWFANLSYVDAEDRLDLDGKMTGSVNWLLNLGVDWQATADTRHALRLHYVGEQEGWDVTRTPSADHFDAYNTLDYTLSVENLFNVAQLGLAVSINNLADNHYDTVPNPAFYPQGLSQGERTGWLQLTYQY